VLQDLNEIQLVLSAFISVCVCVCERESGRRTVPSHILRICVLHPDDSLFKRLSGQKTLALDLPLRRRTCKQRLGGHTNLHKYMAHDPPAKLFYSANSFVWRLCEGRHTSLCGVHAIGATNCACVTYTYVRDLQLPTWKHVWRPCERRHTTLYI
jgi:hypothetical protein